MAKTITYEEQLTLETISCSGCGVTYAMPARLLAKRRSDGEKFYCPNGHTQVFIKTDASRVKDLQAELDRQKIRLSQTEADAKWQREKAEKAERSLAATKGVVTRIKNRVHNGVCPCCSRSFQNLKAHIQRQHPAWKDEAP